MIGQAVAPKFIALICGVLLVCNVRAQAPAQTQKMEIELLTVYAANVHPARISRPSGPFILVILNQTDYKQMVVDIKAHTDGSDKQQASMDDVGGSYRGILDLPVGQYDVVVPGRPNLQATITITN